VCCCRRSIDRVLVHSFLFVDTYFAVWCLFQPLYIVVFELKNAQVHGILFWCCMPVSLTRAEPSQNYVFVLNTKQSYEVCLKCTYQVSATCGFCLFYLQHQFLSVLFIDSVAVFAQRWCFHHSCSADV